MATDVFNLRAVLGLDSAEFDKGLDKASGKTQTFGQKLASGLGTFAKVGLATATAAIGAAAAGIASLTKQATENYAEYEQLVGGVETLFGDSAAKVMADASSAFKDAGMSMNDYMETSIQSAAALINSLGGDQAKAADLMNVSIVDMSDNVNKMGTSMEAVQNAYRGFSRGNFTMLDNLALGFAGTKEGMQQLLEAAQQISGVEYDISSYSDIVQAIHVVQEEMGIAGTTAKEASETISGSFAATRAAWQNLVTAFGNKNANLGPLIENLIQSAETALGNLLPVVEQAINGIARAVEAVAPIIAERLPALVDSVLPPLLNAASTLVNALVAALPSILQALLGIAPSIINSLIETTLSMLPQIIQLGAELLVSLSNGIVQSLPDLIPVMIDVVMSIVDTVLDNVDMMVDASIELILALANGLIEALPKLIERIPEIIVAIIDAIVRNLPKIIEAGVLLLEALIEGIVKTVGALATAVADLINGIKKWFTTVDWSTLGKNLIDGIVNGVKRWASNLWDTVKNLASEAVRRMKSALGIASPSKVFANEVGRMIPAGIAQGIEKNLPALSRTMEDMIGEVKAPAISFSATANGGWANSTVASGAQGGMRFGDVHITINGANYSNENELARAIGRELQSMSDRRAAIFA